MAKTSCVLDIMEQNGFIEVEKCSDYIIPKYIVNITNITNPQTRKEIEKKIEEKIKSDNEYIHIESKYTGPCYSFKADLDNFIKEYINRGNEKEVRRERERKEEENDEKALNLLNEIL